MRWLLELLERLKLLELSLLKPPLGRFPLLLPPLKPPLGRLPLLLPPLKPPLGRLESWLLLKPPVRWLLELSERLKLLEWSLLKPPLWLPCEELLLECDCDEGPPPECRCPCAFIGTINSNEDANARANVVIILFIVVKFYCLYFLCLLEPIICRWFNQSA